MMTLVNQPVSMLGLLAAMALVPFAAVMLTSFAKIVVVLSFARSAVRHSCTACDWDPALSASLEGHPPPVSRD